MKNNLKIGIALSGGGVKGFAHIGALQVLEENGIIPSFIAGTSMGSLIGALYCSGMTPKELEENALNTKLGQFADLNLIISRGLMSGKKLVAFLNSFIENKNIENCVIPYCAVGIDLISGKEYVINSGNLAEAVRISCSVPGLFEPIKRDDKILIDGGILNNNPSDVAKKMGADFVISVNVNADYTVQLPTKSMINVLINSFNLAICENEKLRKKHCDHLIKITMPDVKVESFKKENIIKAIEYGKIITRKQIKTILKKIENAKK